MKTADERAREHMAKALADERATVLAPLRTLADEILVLSTEANGADGATYELLKTKVAARGIDLAKAIQKLGSGS